MALETRTQRNRLGYKAHTNKTQPASGGPEGISGKISGINLGWADDLPYYPLRAKVRLCLCLIVSIIILGSLINLIFPSKLGIVNTLKLDWDVIIFTGLSIVAWISFLFSLLRIAACLSPKPAPLNMPHYKANIADDLPQYTILVPLFKEANMVKGLIEALSQITYPKDRLQILLICEIIDPQTIRQVQFHLKPPFSLIIVPKGTPQTKPRALNYALQFAKGDFITIYDAEDRPHKDQLLQAVSAFKANPDWAALQAPLDYFNANDNWLTRQFSLEYAALFHVWLPWLARMKLPFPLGGTSNHMRHSALKLIGGWDAHNVTEDADMSFRLAAYGYQIGYITPPTDEEAVSHLPSWHFQRARWLKGYLQTWLVHMGKPFAPGGLTGLRRFLCLQITLGITLLSVWFYVPSLFAMSSVILWTILSEQNLALPNFYLFSFLISILSAILMGYVGALRCKKSFLTRETIYMPLYWALLFAPSLRALWELRYRPFHWHKTRHGVSSVFQNTSDSKNIAHQKN